MKCESFAKKYGREINNYDLIKLLMLSTQSRESISYCIRFLSNLCKNANLFSIANDCSVNPSDLSKMLVKKQMKYFDVPLDHTWKVPVLQELLNTRTNNLYVE